MPKGAYLSPSKGNPMHSRQSRHLSRPVVLLLLLLLLGATPLRAEPTEWIGISATWSATGGTVTATVEETILLREESYFDPISGSMVLMPVYGHFEGAHSFYCSLEWNPAALSLLTDAGSHPDGGTVHVHDFLPAIGWYEHSCSAAGGPGELAVFAFEVHSRELPWDLAINVNQAIDYSWALDPRYPTFDTTGASGTYAIDRGVVPEPGTAFLVGAALLGGFGIRRRT